jgi:D-alanine-D-alanine ligase
MHALHPPSGTEYPSLHPKMDTVTSSRPGSKRLNIALVYELRTTHLNLGYTPDECAELACESCVQGISSALEKLGHNVVHMPEGIKSLVQSLSKGQQKEWDLVFNYSEGIRGVAREARVPGLLEAYDIPFTFSGAATFALCLDKAKTNVGAPLLLHLDAAC